MHLADLTPMVLLGALALAAGGCGQQGDAAASQPVGKVVDVSGTVQAARDGAAWRALGDGDPVYRDDTVTTGPDGAVTILLAHNQARWSIAAGRMRRVDRSAAWRAEAGSAGAFDDERALPTSAAGRHSEPQAGDTRATAPTPAPAAEQETRVAEAPAAPEPREPRRRSSSRRPTERAKGSASPGAAPEQPRTRGLALGAVPDTGGEGGGGEREDTPMAVPTDRGAKLRALVVSGARSKKELAAAMAASFGEAVQLCAQEASRTGEVVVSFEIGRAGDVDDVKVSGPRALVAVVGACLRAKAEELSFPRRREGSTRVRQTVRFEVP